MLSNMVCYTLIHSAFNYMKSNLGEEISPLQATITYCILKVSALFGDGLCLEFITHICPTDKGKSSRKHFMNICNYIRWQPAKTCGGISFPSTICRGYLYSPCNHYPHYSTFPPPGYPHYPHLSLFLLCACEC